MKKLKYFTFLIIPILLISCSSELQENIVQVVAKDFRFEVADQIPSGWSTFEFDNQGHAEHFFLLQKLPDTVSYDTYVNNVTKSFDTVFDSIKAGSTKAEAVDLLLKLVPSWYFTSVKQMGGTGIVSSNKNTRVTLKLEPGIYAMECYIKEQGIFHTALGMISRLEVTTDRSQNIPPEADVELTLSNFKIDSKGELESGAV
jgi:hypothetical protein